jgi:hypothetical protein
LSDFVALGLDLLPSSDAKQKCAEILERIERERKSDPSIDDLLSE